MPNEGRAARRKISIVVHIDEDLFADLKLLHIRPSTVIDRKLRREVRRRKRAIRLKERGQLVNRFSGEVLDC